LLFRSFFFHMCSFISHKTDTLLLSPRFTYFDGYSTYIGDDILETGMLCATRCNESLDWLVIANLSLHIHVRAVFSVSSRNEYFYTPKYNSPRSSRHFLEQLWKLIRFYFGNPDTYCLPATLLLFHPLRSFFRVPFVLVTHCQKHARNEISITFFIPSRTYIYFNFTLSLWLLPLFTCISLYIYLSSFHNWNKQEQTLFDVDVNF